MRLLASAIAVAVSLSVWACGSSSSNNLFSGTGPCAPGATVACVGPMSCSGHGTCGPNGQVATCVCDAANMGAGGVIESGGAGSGGMLGGSGGESFGGSGGVPFGTGGSGGFSDTGGQSGGGLDGSIASGGQGGGTGGCPEGHYTGTYKGTYGTLFSMQQVNGTIEFTVDANGGVMGKYQSVVPDSNSKADLVGNVNCSTLELPMRVENGTYPGLIGDVKFSGTMPGTFSSSSRSWSGTWMLSDNNSRSGSGTWTAN